MEADDETRTAIRALVGQAYQAMSTPGSDVAAVFGHEDMTVSGSGMGELMYGQDEVIAVATMIASQGAAWVPEQVKVWQRGDVAWGADPWSRHGGGGRLLNACPILDHGRLRTRARWMAMDVLGRRGTTGESEGMRTVVLRSLMPRGGRVASAIAALGVMSVAPVNTRGVRCGP